MFDDYKDIVNIKELMKMLGVGRDCAYNLINSGEIKSFKMGNKIKIPKRNVIEFVDSKVI